MGENTLFFDVETTGLPKNYKAHYSQVDNWPRIVQLSWLVSDLDGNVFKESDNIIKVNFPIPLVVSRIHGITNEVAEAHGVPILQVLQNFLTDLTDVGRVVCHNVDFDSPILHSELVRAGLPHPIQKKSFCTMKNTTEYCRLPGQYGNYKWPKLEELYRFCFGQELTNAHNAMADVRATHKVFYHLVREKVFS